MDQASSHSQEKQLLLIDTDAGLDDAQAILIALSAPHVEVVGITTVTGNVAVDQVTKNVLRLLKMAKREDIPVYRGTEKALTCLHKEDECSYHGKDGFGDVPDENPPDLSLLQTKHGVQALLDITKEYTGKITLVALGPLTNIALAVRLDPNIGKRLKSCYIMGGNYKGEGNVTPSAEFNFYCDPEAVHIVLSDLKCPITLTCWELCLEYSFSWDTYQELRSFNTTVCKWMKKMEEITVNKCASENWPTYVPCDEICMACVIDTSVIKDSFECHSSVELLNIEKRAALIVNRSENCKDNINTRIITKIDLEKYKSMLIKIMQ